MHKKSVKKAGGAEGVKIYCGPDIKKIGVKRNTAFSEIPKVLSEAVTEFPAIEKMIVPSEKYAEVRVKVKIPGTFENIIFGKIKEHNRKD